MGVGFALQDKFNYIGSVSAAPSLDMSLLKYQSETVRPELVLLCTATNETKVWINGVINFLKRMKLYRYH